MSPAASKGGGGTTSSIWTPANVVTCVRVVAVPLWLLVAEFSPAAGTGSAWSLGVFLFFVVLSLTDKLDGYLARSRNEVTTFGKFLDPIADKLVVVVALCFLLERGGVSLHLLWARVRRLSRWLPSQLCFWPWRFPRAASRAGSSSWDRSSWSLPWCSRLGRASITS